MAMPSTAAGPPGAEPSGGPADANACGFPRGLTIGSKGITVKVAD
jgi:hypothetical protein